MYHMHYYSGITSFADGHRHYFRGETSKAQSGMRHTHNIAGYTTFSNGHTHYYAIKTSPDYPVLGGYIHYISGMTQITEEHYHLLRAHTNISQ
jgi:hypothetical protein